MTIGELKRSLARFSSDMDDCEVIFNYMENGEESFDSLAFVAYSEINKNNTIVLVLGSQAVAFKRMKNGTLKYADGRSIDTQGFDLSGNGN